MWRPVLAPVDIRTNWYYCNIRTEWYGYLVSEGDSLVIASHNLPVSTARSDSRAAAPGRLSRLAAARFALAVATVLMGLIAGFFYAYACSVMIGLANTDDRTFIIAMQEINASVRNVWFAPSFFGSLVATAVAAALAGWTGNRRVLAWTIGGLILYATAFAMTMAISVPLNDQLAVAGTVEAMTELAAVRTDYEDSWVRWNVARTAASTAALVCLVRASMVQRLPDLAGSRP